MNWIDIECTDLTSIERDQIADAEKLWKKLGNGAHLDDWLSICQTIMIGRRLAMRQAHANRPEGRAYVEAMSQWMRERGFDTMQKTAVSCGLWLLEEPGRLEILQGIRAKMTVGERSRLNSPISARQRVEKVLAQRAEQPPRISQFAKLKEANEQQQRTIARLQEQLKRDGSLFDLGKDTAGDIADVIIRSVSARKAEQIGRAILRATAKPAG